jgi:hypothetical protein
MAEGSYDSVPRLFAATGDDAAAYRDGYESVMREIAWARRYGWTPTERQLVIAVTQAQSVYASARRGKFIGGQRPEWLHGRADALRELLHAGVGAFPTDEREG